MLATSALANSTSFSSSDAPEFNAANCRPNFLGYFWRQILALCRENFPQAITRNADVQCQLMFAKLSLASIKLSCSLPAMLVDPAMIGRYCQ
jgi:hypothetical protein